MNFKVWDRVIIKEIIPINHDEIPEHYKCLEVGDVGTVTEVFEDSISLIVDGKINVLSQKNFFRLNGKGLESILRVNGKEIKLSTFEEVRDKVFSSITIHKRETKHQYSNCECMILELWYDDTGVGQPLYIAGEETDVLSIKIDEFKIDIYNGCVNLYDGVKYLSQLVNNRRYGFKIAHIGDTIFIE